MAFRTHVWCPPASHAKQLAVWQAILLCGICHGVPPRAYAERGSHLLLLHIVSARCNMQQLEALAQVQGCEKLKPHCDNLVVRSLQLHRSTVWIHVGHRSYQAHAAIHMSLHQLSIDERGRWRGWLLLLHLASLIFETQHDSLVSDARAKSKHSKELTATR